MPAVRTRFAVCFGLSLSVALTGLGALAAEPVPMAGDLSPLSAAEWSPRHAAHLLERAGFGGTPDEIAALAQRGPRDAVQHLVRFAGVTQSQSLSAPFDHSGIFDPGLDPFPAGRPATTDLARATGQALGIEVKPGGNRRMQPVVNQFFYWLRASRLEADRVAYWWANRMLTSPRPLQEKMALFWHGHFATNEDKVRDYRKMLKQLETFQRDGLGDFRSLIIAVAQDPAMLAFLDAGVNVKGAPNENFAREIMELFTMGVGHYTERDIREAARAFTGWNYDGLAFKVTPARHDAGPKTILGQTAPFDGVQVIDLILQQPVTGQFIATKLYRYFVRDEVSPALQVALGDALRKHQYQIAPFLEQLFLSRDFYAPRTMAARIKSPVELVISTYRKLGLTTVPGVPDFNEVTARLGQKLLAPPTVAGWAQGRAWITPGLLIERGNFVLDVVFPDITYIAQDRYPVVPSGNEIRSVHSQIRAGVDISTATKPVGRAGPGASAGMPGEPMALSNQLADRDEDFNTRYASYRGWQMAIERVKPIPRTVPRLDLSQLVAQAKLSDPLSVVLFFERRFLSVELSVAARRELAAFLEKELGTADIRAAATYSEEALRQLLHILLSRPEYQLG